MNTQTNNSIILSRRDYLLVTLIGVSFALFAIPILKNIKLAFLPLDFTTILALVIFFGIFANVAIWLAAVLGRKIPIVFQFAKFAAVGAFNTFLDWGVLNFLIALTGIAAGFGYSLFKGISFLIATVSSYLWNKYWTFGSQEKTTAQEFGRFFSVSFVGMLINITIASVVVNVIGPPASMSLERWANIGAGVATIVSLFWNFIGYKLWVFKK